MYDWLQAALENDSTIVTANRRLARELQNAWNARQLARGIDAWRTPEVRPLQGWLTALVAGAGSQADLPTRINAHQSQVLWEGCLRKELGDDITGMPVLVRHARDTWQRLADARVPICDVARAARTEDQRLYASAAGRYLAVLENEAWVDDTGLAALALDLVTSGRVSPGGRFVFAGFDRQRPSMTALQDALRAAGCDVSEQPAVDYGATPVVHEFEQRDAELRAAGAWARKTLEAQPDARIAIVAPGLDQSGRRDLRLVREGFVPGWQYGPVALRDAVNVSLGQRLSDYPAVGIALLALRWLVHDLSAREVARLLQSPLIGSGELGGRSRLELRLRQLPDRAWAPSMLTSALRGTNETPDASDWLARIAAFSKRRRELPRSAAPSAWVMILDECLARLGWPGPETRSSDAYQLINRWRELLNDFARLDIVASSMTPRVAISRLEQMAADTVFQPENRDPAVQLMGALEASGAEFDAVWLAGMTAANWPPPGSPTPLVSRTLQIECGMPDATPADTREWAEATLRRLSGAAPVVVCSYALVDEDIEQAASDLLGDFERAETPPDPGWQAASLVGRGDVRRVDDAVPPVASETIFGGAGTVQQQLSEPFSAFAFGRLGARVLERQALGVPAVLRGNLVHETMFRLYRDLPSADAIREATDEEVATAVSDAADGALRRHLRNSGPVLGWLLQLERDRIVGVVTSFIGKDRERDDFKVAALEGELEFRRGPMRLQLRFDRIDRFNDGSIGIIDYKTGAARTLLQRDGTVREAQLFVYALASDEPVAMLALANLDARETGFSGAGRGFTDEAKWPDLLAAVGTEIETSCNDLVTGDVRIVAEQGVGKARGLNVLSRYTELRRGS
jgi:probable DNA repair protein